MRKILTVTAVAAACAGFVLYSLPDVRRAAPSTDYFSAPAGLSAVASSGAQWGRVPAGQAPAPDAWYLPLSAVDGVYFRGTDTGAVATSSGAVPATVRLASSGAYVVSANDPFASYVVEDAGHTFRIRPLQNGIFAIVSDGAGARVYSVNAILSFTLLDGGKPATSVDVFPGSLLDYDPRTAAQLKGADALRVTQVNALSYVDVRDDGLRDVTDASGATVRTKSAPDFSERVFGTGSGPFVRAVFGDVAAQVAQYRAVFAERAGAGLSSVPGAPDPLRPSGALLNRRKEAVGLQNLLLRRLNDMADAPGKFDQKYLTEILDRIAALGPDFSRESLDLVRKFYTLYWIDGVYSGNQDILLADDGFAHATRGLFGCDMAAPYFSGLSNLFLAYLYHQVLPPTDGKAVKMDAAALDLYLRKYIFRRMSAAGSAGQVSGNASGRPSAPAANAPSACQSGSSAEGITDANVRSFWLFLVQYLDRARPDAAPSSDTLGLSGIMVTLGKRYLESVASREFDFRKTEMQTMLRYYRSIFPRLVAGLESDIFQTMAPVPVFREDRIQGNELQIDRATLIELEKLSKALSSLADYLTSPAALAGGDLQARSIRSFVDNALRPQVHEPILYLYCLLSNERAYRYADAAEKSAFCRQEGDAQPGFGAVPVGAGMSGVGAELRARVEDRPASSGAVLPPPLPPAPVLPPPAPRLPSASGNLR